ncbi:MAG: 6-phosphogluconolactonase [Verrucomicrobia bacterium]|nr:6-phosphogluconolactonase [Verrucomicrobiota bacterium]
MSRFETLRFDSSSALAHTAASRWLDLLAMNPGAPFHVALAGGRIARVLFAATAMQALNRQTSFDGVQFFWGDERCVPPTDAESNFRSAAELLLTPLKVRAEQVHRIHGEADPGAAAAEAAAELCRTAARNGEGQPVLDLVFLGMGEDGHIASLFPGENETVMNSPAVYRAVVASKLPPRRITLGYAALAAAREVWVLASGAGKEDALRASLNGDTPLARLLRLRERTVVFTDIVSDQR